MRNQRMQESGSSRNGVSAQMYSANGGMIGESHQLLVTV